MCIVVVWLQDAKLVLRCLQEAWSIALSTDSFLPLIDRIDSLFSECADCFLPPTGITDTRLQIEPDSSFSQSSSMVDTLLINPILLILSNMGEVWSRKPVGGSKQELGCSEKRLEKLPLLVGQVRRAGWSESRERGQYSRVGVAGVINRVEVKVFVIVCFTDTER